MQGEVRGQRRAAHPERPRPPGAPARVGAWGQELPWCHVVTHRQARPMSGVVLGPEPTWRKTQGPLSLGLALPKLQSLPSSLFSVKN